MCIRDRCTPDALVAIHLDNLNLGMYKDAMNAWERDNVDYDVLGASSYAFWAGKNMLENVRKAGEYVASRGKLFAVLETSWLNSQKDADGTVNMVNNTCLLYTSGTDHSIFMDCYVTVSAVDAFVE